MSLRDRMILRGGPDRHIAWEVWDRDDDGLVELHRQGVQVMRMLDVGAHIGAASLLAVDLWTDVQVAAFEPDAESFSTLVQNAALCGGAVRAFPYGVAATTGRREFLAAVNSIWGASGCNRLYEGGPIPTNFRKIAVECVTLTGALDLAGWDSCDLLKMDCEGAELEILDGAVRDGSIDRVGRIAGEWHGLQAGARITDLLSPLFDVTYTFNTDHPNTLGLFRASRRT